MANVKLAYGSATSITITLNSLGSGSIAVATEVVNTTDLFEDVLIELLLDPGTAASPFAINVYISTSIDETNFSETTNVENMVFLGSIYAPSTTALRARAFSVAQAMGTVPPEWKLVVQNQSGAALNSSGNSAQYRGVYRTVT